MRGIVLILSFLLLLLPELQVAAEIKEVTVIQTTDTHGRIFGSSNGWLKTAPAIRQTVESSGGAANCLVIDCGDLLQGAPESAFFRGAIMVKILNSLSYDAWIPGNHDFDFGIDVLNSNARQFHGKALAANIKSPQLMNSLEAWQLFTKNNLKIAVIGMTSPNLLNYLWQPAAGKMKVYGIENALERIIAAVRQAKPDIIVLAIHHGQYSKDTTLYNLIMKYPEIDLILGGHTHQEVSGTKIGQNCWFVQAGHAANCFGRIKILWDTDSRKIAQISSALVPVKADTPDDRALLAAIGDDLHKASDSLSTPVPGRSEAIKEITAELADAPGKIIARSMAESAGIDAALYNYGGKPIKPELCLTGKTIFYLMPFEDTVCTLTLNSADFKSVLQEQLAELKRLPSICGITAKLKPKSSSLLRLFLPDGTEWRKPERKIKVAFSSFAMAGGGGRFPRLKELAADSKNLPEDTGMLVRDCLRKYIEKAAAR
jgi:2',3'-cyclic-nucleotide 2'-phosphodiesterase/3'-nucleotidase